MIDLMKPIRDKRTGEIVKVEKRDIFKITYVTQKSFGMPTTIILFENEFNLHFENVPEQEYTFQEACEMLMKGTAKKFMRETSYCDWILKINNDNFVDENGDNFVLNILDLKGKWRKVE